MNRYLDGYFNSPNKAMTGTVLSNKQDVSTDYGGHIIQYIKISYDTVVENSTLEVCWLLDLETILPLEQYRSDHDSYSSYGDCEEQPLVL